MATHDDNPQHDSREGAPVYRGADEPDAGASRPDRDDDALGQDTTAAHDNREDDQIYQQAPASGSGGADSFDSRHNEFDSSEGQAGAGIDKETGEAVHGDGTKHEQADEPSQQGFDADQPQQVDDGSVEPNAEQPREQR